MADGSREWKLDGADRAIAKWIIVLFPVWGLPGTQKGLGARSLL